MLYFLNFHTLVFSVYLVATHFKLPSYAGHSNNTLFFPCDLPKPLSFITHSFTIRSHNYHKILKKIHCITSHNTLIFVVMRISQNHNINLMYTFSIVSVNTILSPLNKFSTITISDHSNYAISGNCSTSQHSCIYRVLT
jgi:hypothetical protein